VALTAVTTALAAACTRLEKRIVHYEDDRLLSDDRDADPYQRLGEMGWHLAALALALTEASVQTQAYHGAATQALGRTANRARSG
jgi:hypothetical protein